MTKRQHQARRKRTERRIAQRIRGALQRFYRRIAREIEAAPPVKSWQDALPDLEAELRALLEPLLRTAARDGVREARTQVPRTGLDWELVNERAAAWARSYAGTVASGVAQTAQQRIKEQIAQFVETPGMTLQDLINKTTGRSVSEYRASVIAITETTRAYAEGNQAVWREAGISKHAWSTANDEIVCEWCGPANGRVVSIGQSFGYDIDGNAVYAPPWHPNCRCNLVPVVDDE